MAMGQEGWGGRGDDQTHKAWATQRGDRAKGKSKAGPGFLARAVVRVVARFPKPQMRGRQTEAPFGQPSCRRQPDPEERANPPLSLHSELFSRRAASGRPTSPSRASKHTGLRDYRHPRPAPFFRPPPEA